MRAWMYLGSSRSNLYILPVEKCPIASFVSTVSWTASEHFMACICFFAAAYRTTPKKARQNISRNISHSNKFRTTDSSTTHPQTKWGIAPARRSFAFIINPPMMPDKTLPHAEVNAENDIFHHLSAMTLRKKTWPSLPGNSSMVTSFANTCRRRLRGTIRPAQQDHAAFTTRPHSPIHSTAQAYKPPWRHQAAGLRHKAQEPRQVAAAPAQNLELRLENLQNHIFLCPKANLILQQKSLALPPG